MGREVRRVRADWEHPRDADGDYIPLFDNPNGRERDKNGRHKGHALTQEDAHRTGWYHYRHAPERGWDMPDWPERERTHFMYYDSTTEGTPLSPAFATVPELSAWIAENSGTTPKMTAREWEPLVQDALACGGAF